MDPDELLKQIRALTMRTAPPITVAEARFLQDAVSIMDEWISNGGFLPAAWRNGRCSPACESTVR